MRSSTILLLSVLGCGADAIDTQPQAPVRVGSPGTLAPALLLSDVQPMLDRMCAQTACHGSPERGLFLYSTYGARLGSTLTTLSTDELQANLDACAAFLSGVDDVTDSMLLSRPLRFEAGGTLHGGGDQFYDRADPGYELFACWLLGRTYEGLTCRY